MSEKNISRDRRLAQEELILDATEGIWGELKRRGMRKIDLAEKLGVSKAYITQTLDGGRNLTLRSLADFAWALDCHARVLFAPQEFDESRSIIESSVELVGQTYEVDESVWVHDRKEVDFAA